MEVLVQMTREDAEKCVARINSNFEDAAYAIKDLHDKEGWRALGYSSWSACCAERFDYSRSHIYRILKSIGKTISSGDSQVVSFRDTASQNPNEKAPLENSKTVPAEPSDNDGELPEVAAKVAAPKPAPAIQQAAKAVAPVEAVRVDCDGWTIPPDVLPLWDRADQTSGELISLSRKIAGILRAGRETVVRDGRTGDVVDQIYSGVLHQDLIAAITRLIGALKGVVPHAVCTGCDGNPKAQKGGKCDFCKGRGYISIYQHHQSDPLKIAARKAAL